MTFYKRYDGRETSYKMKTFKILLVTFMVLSVFACSKDDTGQDDPKNQFADFNSQICQNITGIKALFWDYANGLPTPLAKIPTIKNPGDYFIHSAYPQLGFQLPQGYTAFEVSQAQPPLLGVNVIRNDNRAVWRYVPINSLDGQVTVSNAVASEVNGMFNFYGFNGNFNVLCSETKTTDFGGVQLVFSARLIEFGEFTGLVYTNLTFSPSINLTQVSSFVAAAPTADFDFEVFNTFLPISFQLLVIDDGVRDSDLDGFPDNEDAFPFDPNRH